MHVYITIKCAFLYIQHLDQIAPPSVWILYTCIYTYIYVYIHSIRMCVSKYNNTIKSHHHVRECFRIVCLESQRLHHRHTCAPPHSLHRLYLPVLPLTANVCACEITSMHTRTNTRLGDNTPSPSTHKGGVWNVFEQTLRQLKRNGLYLRVGG